MTDGVQGFDEFMNLVIDDAVEVSLAQKDKPESRRTLGPYIYPCLSQRLLTYVQVKSYSRATTSP